MTFARFAIDAWHMDNVAIVPPFANNAPTHTRAITLQLYRLGHSIVSKDYSIARKDYSIARKDHYSNAHPDSYRNFNKLQPPNVIYRRQRGTATGRFFFYCTSFAPSGHWSGSLLVPNFIRWTKLASMNRCWWVTGCGRKLVFWGLCVVCWVARLWHGIVYKVI